MTIMSDMRAQLESLCALSELDVTAADLPASVDRLCDASVITALENASHLANDIERLRVALAGVAARRSSRDRGHEGLAAKNGHRTPASFIQHIGGGTRVEAERHVRLGAALLEGVGGAGSTPEASDAAASAGEQAVPWHEPLRRALLDGTLTAAQHDAIFRGLGEPPNAEAHAGTHTHAGEAAISAWSMACARLLDEAGHLTAEDLSRQARHLRDLLDPIGAEDRFARQFDARAFRVSTDAHGQQHAHIVFDAEMAAWVRSIIDAALRPRRGGPRFVDSEEARSATALGRDPRTNDQLTYDLMMDVWRAGATAEAEAVYGARQPGVRMVVIATGRDPRTDDPFSPVHETGHVEDSGMPLPASVLDRAVCSVGAQSVTFDRAGNPLDVGREHRLFTPRQRIALAIRDGGCMFPGCGLPPSYCEAHHADHWAADRGRTDIDRGILLCRFHHMLLHNRKWRITRRRNEPFILHPPRGEGDPIVLTSKSSARWAWDPPPAPDRPRWREGHRSPVAAT